MLETKGRTILVWFCVHFENCLGGGAKAPVVPCFRGPFCKEKDSFML